MTTRGVRGRYCLAGVGETEYSRGSGRSTRALGVEAVRRALEDAGLAPGDVDGMLSYHSNDSTPSPAIAADLGIRLATYADVVGGGSSTEGLVAYAMGLMEVGLCRAVVIFRAMNGYSEFRIGGTGARAAAPVRGLELADRPYGMLSAGQRFAPAFMRHMYEYGTTSAQVAHVKVAHSRHAAANPKALLRTPVTVEEVLASRWVVKPLHLLDCCIETDNATALVVTPAERARDGPHRPVYVLAAAGRVNKDRPDYLYQGRFTTAAGVHARDRVFDAAGVRPDDVDVTGAYDAFTFTAMLQLEAFGFCERGAGGAYVASGAIALGGRRPNNTSGGHLCEGYTHGMSMVIENVRQLRGTVDDYCPGAADGVHTHDYRPGGCRQVRDARVAMNMGWASPATGSALILGTAYDR